MLTTFTSAPMPISNLTTLAIPADTEIINGVHSIWGTRHTLDIQNCSGVVCSSGSRNGNVEGIRMTNETLIGFSQQPQIIILLLWLWIQKLYVSTPQSIFFTRNDPGWVATFSFIFS